MKAEILVEVKKEIQKMLDAGFISRRYAEWISNVVPVEKKDGRWRIAIDFRNLNSATPKDEYPMPVAETLINAAAGYKVLSFMDGNAGFGIPQTITTDGGSVFVSKEFRKFCEDMGIKLIRSSPYYAQANGQAEASNKSPIKLIKRKIDEHPRRWHEARSRRVTFQNDLTTEEYAALMSDIIEDATELRLWSLEKIKENKAKVARAYNKKVKPKEFQVGDPVWEAVLPLGTKDKMYGKWSPNWHGPYKVDQVLKGNAYMLEQLDGVKFPVAVNGQHLKKYFPSMWDDEQIGFMGV
ncbi:hypothetical protein QYE76_044739 [Lolium multiflorum]|uniref:Integrase catalytic domain-containing protein n=1 Tax=Lolium multiflorum TaxID=4521 RepID=A0AAD8TLM7_LOLMU|nr:hypothetical protein QYE76_044739 [Lolium multiflorum]